MPVGTTSSGEKFDYRDWSPEERALVERTMATRGERSENAAILAQLSADMSDDAILSERMQSLMHSYYADMGEDTTGRTFIRSDLRETDERHAWVLDELDRTNENIASYQAVSAEMDQRAMERDAEPRPPQAFFDAMARDDFEGALANCGDQRYIDEMAAARARRATARSSSQRVFGTVSEAGSARSSSHNAQRLIGSASQAGRSSASRPGANTSQAGDSQYSGSAFSGPHPGGSQYDGSQSGGSQYGGSAFDSPRRSVDSHHSSSVFSDPRPNYSLRPSTSHYAGGGSSNNITPSRTRPNPPPAPSSQYSVPSSTSTLRPPHPSRHPPSSRPTGGSQYDSSSQYSGSQDPRFTLPPRSQYGSDYGGSAPSEGVPPSTSRHSSRRSGSRR